MKSLKYLGLDCIELENRQISLVVSRSAGPRVLSLRLQGGENLLAELPDITTPTPRFGEYHFYGGHRLWLSPEDLDRTYMPDDHAVEVSETAGGVTFTQPADPVYGIEKALHITLAADSARVVIVHTLTNKGREPQECAPWAITQLRRGGTAILPQEVRDAGFLANRMLVLWSYTDIRSPHILWGNRTIFVQSQMQEGALKLGFPNRRGWLAYWLEGTLFVKKAAYDPSVDYYDFGSSSECYCNNRFLELETLGSKTTLMPGQSVTHTETWELYPHVDFQPDEEYVQRLIDILKLESER